MPQPTDTRLLHLIDLLEALLARDAAPPMMDRLDQLVEHLSQIDVSLSRAASAMRDMAHRTPLPTAAEELTSLHHQTLEYLAQMLDQQHQMQRQISALADLLGMPPLDARRLADPRQKPHARSHRRTPPRRAGENARRESDRRPVRRRNHRAPNHLRASR